MPEEYKNKRKGGRRGIGTKYEELAAEFLTSKGMEVLCRNYRTRTGEIDIIVKDGNGVLVFVEVKFRRGSGSGSPEAGVSGIKQRTISRVCDNYLMMNGISPDVPMRFDVVACSEDKLKWYPGAFDYIPV